MASSELVRQMILDSLRERGGEVTAESPSQLRRSLGLSESQVSSTACKRAVNSLRYNHRKVLVYRLSGDEYGPRPIRLVLRSMA